MQGREVQLGIGRQPHGINDHTRQLPVAYGDPTARCNDVSIRQQPAPVIDEEAGAVRCHVRERGRRETRFTPPLRFR